jgi:type I restriction enzyme S subunit
MFGKIALQTTSVAHLGVSRFARLPLPWPSSLAEQEAIAKALDDADAVLDSLEQLLNKKRQIKQGMMQQLLTGRIRLV